MWFWLRHFLLASILIVIAFVLINYEQFRLFEQEEKYENKSQQTKNPAAQGLSDFYAKIRFSQDNAKKTGTDFVIATDLPDTPLTQQLEQRKRYIKPGSAKWTGEKKNRSFEEGSSIKETLQQYAQNEGIELFWYLEKDFIIKDLFQHDAEFLVMLYDVIKAIDSDFQQQIYVYYCPNERAAILTQKQEDYLQKNCLDSLARAQQIRAEEQ